MVEIDQKHAATLDAIRKGEHPPHWPKGVRTITIDEWSIIGIHPQLNQLYWDGHRIEVRKTLDLKWWQITLASITAFSALTVATIDMLTYFGIAP